MEKEYWMGKIVIEVAYIFGRIRGWKGYSISPYTIVNVGKDKCDGQNGKQNET